MAKDKWIVSLSGERADDRAARHFKINEHCNMRIAEDQRQKWTTYDLVNGEWLDHNRTNALAQVAFKNGVVLFEPFVDNVEVRPLLPDGHPKQDKSSYTVGVPLRKKCHHIAFLRTGDSVQFGDHELELSFTYETTIKREPVKEEIRSPSVEVRSSEPLKHEQDDSHAVVKASNDTPPAPLLVRDSFITDAAQNLIASSGEAFDTPPRHRAEASAPTQGVEETPVAGRVYDNVGEHALGKDSPSPLRHKDTTSPETVQPYSTAPDYHGLHPQDDALALPEIETGGSIPGLKTIEVASTENEVLSSTPQSNQEANSFHENSLSNDIQDEPGPVVKTTLKRKRGAGKESASKSVDATTPAPGKRSKTISDIVKTPASTNTPRSTSASSKTSVAEEGTSSRASPSFTAINTGNAGLRILFSGTEAGKGVAFSQVLAKEGASRARKPDDISAANFNFLCIGGTKLKTTAKLLMALVRGHPIVEDSWISASIKQGRLLRAADFHPEALLAIISIDRSKLFAGLTVYITEAARKAYGKHGIDDVKAIILAAGADDVVVKGLRGLKNAQDGIVIGVDDNDGDAMAVRETMTVYKKEWIAQSIMAGELLEDECLRL